MTHEVLTSIRELHSRLRPPLRVSHHPYAYAA
jgi:hypothetical protein